jgi:anaerobic carbon-monoxide dehydrogenase iron sulfur subunit
VSRKVIEVISAKCVGCRICEQWCSYSHGQKVSPSTTRIRVQRLHHEYRNVPVVCRQCGKPSCVNACKFEALSRDAATGAIMIDEGKCTACRMCIKACPYGAVNYDGPGRIVRICDLCKGDPQCVQHCSEGALLYMAEDSIVNENRYNIVKRSKVK